MKAAMGKCKACRVSWTWKPSRLISLRGEEGSRIKCPICGSYLWQTTSWAKAEWRSMDGAPHPKGHEIPIQESIVVEHTHSTIIWRRRKLPVKAC